jgi:chromosome condensin MukBEF MukE localization factor
MQAIGVDVTSMADVMKRAEEAVANDLVQTVTMSLATQRRAVLEAVAFGSFLRDVETHVDESYGLLSPLPVLKGPEGGGPPGMLSA